MTNHKEKFEKLIKTMDIPEARREGTDVNARWFLRNGQIRNANHPNILTAIYHARKLA